MYSPEQFVPQTPPLFLNSERTGSEKSPCATVPDFIDVLESQDNSDIGSQEANVPGTPNIPSQPIGYSIIASTIPVTGSQLHKMHYGTPLLELVLLKSARKHASDYQKTNNLLEKCPLSPDQEQKVPRTPNLQLEQERSKRLSPSFTLGQSASQNLELFDGEEIFPKF